MLLQRAAAVSLYGLGFRARLGVLLSEALADALHDGLRVDGVAVHPRIPVQHEVLVVPLQVRLLLQLLPQPPLRA